VITPTVSYPRHFSLVRSCKDLLPEIVHTRDGSRVVREFLARGTAKVCHVNSSVTASPDSLRKDRKDIIKVLKPYIVTMAKDEDAQLVLFTAFDVIEYVESLLCAFVL
jgi:pumilio homology domain family member 6